MVDPLTSVDISPKMLQVTKHKGVYYRLEKRDIVNFISEIFERYDLIIVAEVFLCQKAQLCISNISKMFEKKWAGCFFNRAVEKQ